MPDPRAQQLFSPGLSGYHTSEKSLETGHLHPPNTHRLGEEECVYLQGRTVYLHRGATVSGLSLLPRNERRRARKQEELFHLQEECESESLSVCGASSTLSICQYTNRHPVHLPDFSLSFFVSLSFSCSAECTEKNKQKREISLHSEVAAFFFY